jgi:hypothetical protein
MATRVVVLKPAFAWTCHGCGAENFELAVGVDEAEQDTLDQEDQAVRKENAAEFKDTGEED